MHPLLRRQLRRCAIESESGPSDQKSWQCLLERISTAYQQVDEDRYLLERSLAVSSEEMNRLYDSLRESEAKLAAEGDKLRATIACLGEGLCMLDREGRVVLLNPEGQRILGWSAGELDGRRFLELVLGSSASTRGVEAQLRDQVRNGDAIFQSKDGAAVPVAYVLDPIRQGDAVLGAVLVFRDITEQKRNEEALVRARESALEASRLKAEFLANMSHEIRTPMNGVIGMAELLLGSELAPDQREYAETIHNSADNLLAILNDILDFSKIEAGRLDLEHVDFHVRAVVHEVVDLLAERAQRKGLEIACLVHPDVPDCLRGDPGRLRQVLMNLVGNGVKFTEIGQIVVTVRRLPCEGCMRLRFEVDDTGIGIPAETQTRLFSSFTQADGSTTRKYGGTGLGLAISKLLVELMEGAIGVRSAQTEGSTFWFEVALEQGAEVEPLPALREHLGGVRILVVDDNDTNRRIFELLASGWGAQVELAQDGEAGLAALRAAAERSELPDLVLVDFSMPGMDGFGFACAVRAEAAYSGVRLVLLSSMVDRVAPAEIHAAGFAGYLTKPVRESRLFECLATVVDIERVPRAQAAGSRRRLVDWEALCESRFRQRMSVLLAEDNPVNRRVAVLMLEKLGCAVDVVEDGEEAVRATLSRAYDLVLMDCHMPRLDGFEATRAIRRRETTTGGHVKIVALTAHAMPGDRDLCLAAGMDDYLPKPIKIAELATALRRLRRAG